VYAQISRVNTVSTVKNIKFNKILIDLHFQSSPKSTSLGINVRRKIVIHFRSNWYVCLILTLKNRLVFSYDYILSRDLGNRFAGDHPKDAEKLRQTFSLVGSWPAIWARDRESSLGRGIGQGDSLGGEAAADARRSVSVAMQSALTPPNNEKKDIPD